MNTFGKISFSSAAGPWLRPAASPTPVGSPSRPVVLLKGDIAQQVDLTLTALRQVNVPAQRLFRRGSSLVRRVQDPDTHMTVLEDVGDVASLTFELSRLLQFRREQKVLTAPPQAMVQALLRAEAASWGLPVLNSVVNVPFFSADGTLVQTDGYHEAQAVWLDTGTLHVPPVSARPDATELNRARALLDELLLDCQFADTASRNNALAAILTPHVRELVPEHIPMLLIAAEAPGAGKTTLARIIGKLAAPGPLPTLPEATSEEEWRKRILSVLRGQPRVVFVDNLNQPLDSSPLAGLITLEVFTDRALGGNQMESHRNRGLWMFTANNPEVSSELQRRTSLVSLEARSATPQNRTFHRDDLFGWLEEQRGALLWAIFTLVQHWVASGQPAGQVHEQGMRAYCRVVGGILEQAGYSGVMENMAQLRRQTGRDQEDFQTMVALWREKFGFRKVLATELTVLLVEHLLFPDGLSSHQPALVGKKLKRMAGRVAHGCVIRRPYDAARHCHVYQLELLPT